MPGIDTDALNSFARERVLSSLESRSGAGGFDRSLWRGLAGLGLVGALVDAEYGGGGEDIGSFVAGASILASEGCDLGIALSLIDHVILCAYPLLCFGSQALRERYLPSLCDGERIGAAAISEPGTGGNPSRMKTTATREEQGYRISGTKGPITNAPVADLFLVIASTDPEAGKEGLSAFLLERESGVEVEELELGFLTTSPHGEVVMHGVMVPAANLVGEEGWGHERISRSVFMWERAVIIPVIVAYMQRLHHLVVARLEPAAISPDLRVLLAQRKVEMTAYRALAERLLGAAFGPEGDGRERMELLLFFGKALPAWAESMRSAAHEAGLHDDGTIERMLVDLRLLEVGSSMLDWQFQKLLF